MSKLRWGIIATGGIAGVFARGMKDSFTGIVTAVASRNHDKAMEFAQKHGIPGVHGSYGDLINDGQVDAVYIATPHTLHPALAIEAAKAGKHILCEKPLASTLSDAQKMIAAARDSNVLLMEAYMYRCHPQTKIILDLIKDGRLGQISHIQGCFGFNSPFNPHSRIWNKALGGGGILDVGGYPLSWARLIAGAIAQKPFQNPDTLLASGTLNPQTHVDELAHALLHFPGGLSAEISCGISLRQENALRIYGKKAWLHIPSPYHPGHDGEAAFIHLHDPSSQERQSIPIPTERSIYAFEADSFAQTLQDGLFENSDMTHADTLGNIEFQELWMRKLGITE